MYKYLIFVNYPSKHLVLIVFKKPCSVLRQCAQYKCDINNGESDLVKLKFILFSKLRVVMIPPQTSMDELSIRCCIHMIGLRGNFTTGNILSCYTENTLHAFQVRLMFV